MEVVPWIISLLSRYLFHGGADSTNIPVYPDLDVQKLAGTWYTVAIVMKNKDPMGIVSVDDVLEPTEEGDLVLNMRHIQDGRCKVDKFDVIHTDTPGVFNVPSTNEIVHMVDVDYEHYHIVHVAQNDGYTLYLLCRTREASEDEKKIFKALAEALGFDVNKITYTKLAGKSEIGGMSEECTASIISIVVPQRTLTATCHLF